jgi:hypothetical protein
VLTDFAGRSSDLAYSVAVQADGKAVVAGKCSRRMERSWSRVSGASRRRGSERLRCRPLPCGASALQGAERSRQEAR